MDTQSSTHTHTHTLIKKKKRVVPEKPTMQEIQDIFSFRIIWTYQSRVDSILHNSTDN